jgi:hypothetical protein
MPTLILQQNGIRSGGNLSGPLYIGRRPANSLVVLDPAVSRLHAWIGRTDDHYFIADADSRTGTFVNQERISERRPLNEGDRIAVGPLEMTFHAADTLPADVTPVQFAPSAGADRGVFFECQCGELMWAASQLAGRSAQCAACGAKMKIPGSPSRASGSGHNPEPGTPPPKRAADCGICHSSIIPAELTTTCPECASTFHQSCWNENHGCATYGCGQVNSLEPQAEQEAADSQPTMDVAIEPASPPFPWDYLLLGAAAIAIPAGALVFGAPGLLIAAAAALRLKSATRPGVVWIALALGVVGLALGVVASLFWWYPATLQGRI